MEKIEWLKKNVSIVFIAFGALGMVGSATDYALGFEVVEGMNLVVFSVCAVLSVVGYVGWLVNKEIEKDYKEMDVKLRVERLRAGGDPREDQTIIQRPPRDNA